MIQSTAKMFQWTQSVRCRFVLPRAFPMSRLWRPRSFRSSRVRWCRARTKRMEPRRTPGSSPQKARRRRTMRSRPQWPRWPRPVRKSAVEKVTQRPSLLKSAAAKAEPVAHPEQKPLMAKVDSAKTTAVGTAAKPEASEGGGGSEARSQRRWWRQRSPKPAKVVAAAKPEPAKVVAAAKPEAAKVVAAAKPEASEGGGRSEARSQRRWWPQ
jgi:hypothetical protein